MIKKLNQTAFIISWGSFAILLASSVALHASPLQSQAVQQYNAKQLVSNPAGYISYVIETHYSNTMNEIRSARDQVAKIREANPQSTNLFSQRSTIPEPYNPVILESWLAITKQAQEITQNRIKNIFGTNSEVYKLLDSTAEKCVQTAQSLLSAVKALNEIRAKNMSLSFFRNNKNAVRGLLNELVQKNNAIVSYLKSQQNKLSSLATELDQITHKKGLHTVYATAERRVNAQYKALNETIKTMLLSSILTLYAQLLESSIRSAQIVVNSVQDQDLN